MTGIEKITKERKRQLEQLGWTSEHDSQYTIGQLSMAAKCYIEVAIIQQYPGADEYYNHQEITNNVPKDWPWDKKWWKPSPTPQRNLEKAGALLAADIDRLNNERD